MSPGTRETIEILASLAGSFLLLLIFLILVAASVLLWLIGRGLKLARSRSADIAIWIGGRVGGGQAIAADSMVQVVQPQIQALSAWVGVKAGLTAFVRGRQEPGVDPLQAGQVPETLQAASDLAQARSPEPTQGQTEATDPPAGAALSRS